MAHRIFIVEDHPVMLEGYISLLQLESDLEVVGTADNAEDAFGEITETAPDIAIVDLRLPGVNGIELTKRLRAFGSSVRILIVSAHEEALYAERAFKAGAEGYLMKYESARFVVVAVRDVLAGRRFVSEQLRSQILSQYLDTPSDQPPSIVDSLTDRELEVFELIGKGNTTMQTAEALALSHKTIESHRANIKRKLGVKRNPELIRRAVMWVESPLGI